MQSAAPNLLNTISLENGILIFKTKQDALSMVKALETDSTSALKNAFYAKFPSYVSMYKAFERLTEQDSATILSGSVVPAKYANFVRIERREGVNFVEMMVKSSLVTHLLNQDGLMGYGDVIIKNTYDKLYEVKKEVFDKSQDKELSRFSSKDVGIQTFEHKQIFPTEKNGVQQRWNVDYENWDFPVGGVQRRFSCVISFDPAWAGVCVGVTTKYMQSRWFGFGADQAERIGHYGNVDLRFSERDVQTFFFWNNPNSDKGRILSERVFSPGAPTIADGCINSGCLPNVQSCSITNRIKRYYEPYDPDRIMLR